MKDKILIGIIMVLVLAIFIETAYLFQLKFDQMQKSNLLSQSHKLKHLNRFWKQAPFTFEFHSGYIDPFEEFNRLQDELYNENKKILRNNFQTTDVDIQESEKKYTIKLNLPNLENNKINIETENNSLIVSGGHNIQQEENNNNGFYKQEHSFSSFRRVIALPQNADTAEITTSYENGILVITIPKLIDLQDLKSNMQSVL